MKYTPYANLFVEMLRGDPTLLIRGDEAEESWRIVDPVLESWAAGDVPLQTYKAGDPPPLLSNAGPSRSTDSDDDRKAVST
jgi:glucose-6-phosphate 1-dehydrogenase